MVVISGATGYLGRPLAARLIANGHRVRAVTRVTSVTRVPVGVEPAVADPLDARSIARCVPCGATFVHLVGTPRPAPWKGREFESVDRPAAMASIQAAAMAGAGHFIYVSVAHPAPVMRAYVDVRKACEESLAASGLRHTILRPWYVLGPGHWWPYALTPLYAMAGLVPAWRESARRLGLVTHGEMIAAFEWAVANRPEGSRVMGVAEIRACR